MVAKGGNDVLSDDDEVSEEGDEGGEDKQDGGGEHVAERVQSHESEGIGKEGNVRAEESEEAEQSWEGLRGW